MIKPKPKPNNQTHSTKITIGATTLKQCHHHQTKTKTKSKPIQKKKNHHRSYRRSTQPIHPLINISTDSNPPINRSKPTINRSQPTNPKPARQSTPIQPPKSKTQHQCKLWTREMWKREWGRRSCCERQREELRVRMREKDERSWREKGLCIKY